MKACVYKKYGPPEVVALREIEKPIPKSNEVCVRVMASTICAKDSRLRAFRVPSFLWLPARLVMGVFGPRNKVLGTEFSGVVDGVGEAVTNFKRGDRVFGSSGFGAHAEYVCVAATGRIVGMPETFSFQEAASLPFGAASARHFLYKLGDLKSGQRVLIYGASGAVGVASIQLAKAVGAHVTAVCSGANEDLVKSLGADNVIDYTREDFTCCNDRFDIVFDTIGKTSFAACTKILKPHGRHLFLMNGIKEEFQHIMTRRSKGRRVICGNTNETQDELLSLKHLMDEGYLKPVIDRTYPIGEIVTAHAYVDTGRKKGAVVILVGENGALAQ